MNFRQLFDNMKFKQICDESDVIIVGTSTSGGTGSGISPIIVYEALSYYAHYEKMVLLEVTCQLIEEKVVPKSLLNPICKFISKNGEFSDLTTKTLLETVIAFDNNVKSLKQVNALRSAKKTIDYLWEDDWRHPREVGETE